MAEEKEIIIRGDCRLIRLFLPLLEQGGTIDVRVGGSLRELIIDQLKVEEQYLDHRIQTIFLNARAVDTPEQIVVKHGDVLALSGAMPGLVGATLRKGGRYAAMRREISEGNTVARSNPVPGRIRLKLFNTVLNDLGCKILARGVRVENPALAELLKKNKAELEKDYVGMQLEKKPVNMNTIMSTLAQQGWCRLKVWGAY